MRINKSLIAYTPTSGAGSGSVTSVALSAPTGFTVSGSPITTSGTLAIAFTTGYGIPPLMTGNSGKFLTTNGTTMSWVNIAGTDVTGAALTEVDDTNVTMTLGGTPSTALLRSVSMTLGWAGQLAVSRGGTGAATLTGVIIGNGTSAMTAITGGPNQILRVNGTATGYEFYTATFLTNPMTLNFDMIYQSGGVPARLPGNITTTKQYLTSVGNGTATTSLGWASFTNSDVPGDALTKVDDTNVTLTLGGTPSTAVLRATSLTLGWSGTLAVGRGGTGASTLTGVLIGNGTSAVTAVVGTAGQFLRRNLANTAYEFRTLQGGDIAGSELTKTDDTNVTLSLGGTPASSLLQPVSLTLGWTGQLSVSRGGTGASTLTGVVIGNGTSAMTAVSGTAGQLLRRNPANTAYEFFTASLISGNGVADRVAKWTSATNLVDSQIIDNGTNVGIGVSPTYKLQIAPTTVYSALNTGDGFAIYNPSLSGVNLVLGVNGSGVSQGALIQGRSGTTSTFAIQLQPFGGNVGIGINPSYKLDVDGGIGLSGTLLAVRTSLYNQLYDRDSDAAIYLGGASAPTNIFDNTTHLFRNRGGGVTYATINSTGLGIGISPSYKLDVNGNIGISGNKFAGQSGSYHVISDQLNVTCITIGGTDPTNAYDNTSHLFRSRNGSSQYASIGTSGVQTSNHFLLPSANYITWGGVYGTDIPTISGTSGGGTNGFLQFYPAGSTSGVKMALLRTGQLALPSYTTSTSFSGTAVATLAVTNGGDVITIAPSQTTASGTYTPTWTGLANVGSVTAFSCQYMRVGDTVTVSGWVTIDAVADNTPTSLSFSLPINSNTTSVNYLNGTGVQQGGGAAASLSGYASNYGEFEVSPLVDTAVNYSFHFTYRII